MANYGSVTVTTTPGLIVEENSRRQSVVMTNIGSTVYIGPDASIGTGNSPHIVSNGSFAEDSGGHRVYMGNIYGACTTGTSTVYWWERVGNI
jgi:hypothetical protein